MKSLRNKIHLLIIVFTLAADFHCAGPVNAGSETTSGVEIAVSDTGLHGKTSPGNSVYIFSSDVIPGTVNGFSDSTTVASDSLFSFGMLPDGDYSVLVFDESWKQGVRIGDITITGGSTETYTRSDTLRPTVSIGGTVSVQGGAPFRFQTLVYLAGTSLHDSADSTGGYHISSIPEGVYSICAYQSIQTGESAYRIYTDTIAGVSINNSSAGTSFNMTIVPANE